MKFFPFVFLVSIACLFSSCEEFKLDRQEIFIQVQMAPPEAMAIDSVRVSAEILDWQGIIPIEDHGFIWLSPQDPQDQREPDLFINEGKLALGAKSTPEGPLSFGTVVNSIAASTPYVFRAYVSTGDETFYSNSQPFESGTGGAITLTPNYQRGF